MTISAKGTFTGHDHAVPRFQGAKSGGHERVAISELRRSAGRLLIRQGGWGQARTFVLFAGFPRSGHSLVGAVVDSHPDAVVAHELDAVGLFRAGLSPRRIAALVRANSDAFREAGQVWNGYSYAVPDRSPKGRLRVLGDKKGDWTVRHSVAEPGILPEIARRIAPRRLKVVNVVRNPFDNVATMTLRRGGQYDKAKAAARIAGRPTDAASLLAADTQGQIPTSILSEMVEDYAGLCDGIAAMRTHVPQGDWLEFRHEALIEDPRTSLSRLFHFLDLPDPAEEAAERAARIVARSEHPTRHVLAWSPELRDRVEALTWHHGFLSGYRFDAAPARREGARDSKISPKPSARSESDIGSGLDRVHVISAAGLVGNPELLPHFLDHYTALGIPSSNIHVILNAPEADDPRFDEARDVLRARDAAEPEIWAGPYSSREMWARRQALQRRVTGPGDWVVSADLDELHVYPEGIRPVIDALDALSADYLQGPMIDRIASDGTLPRAVTKPDLFAQFGLEGDLMCQIGKRPERRDAAGTVKVMICAAEALPGLGGHGIDRKASAEHATALEHGVSKRTRRCARGKIAALHAVPLARHTRIKDPAFRLSFPIYVAHFKWHADLLPEIERRRHGNLQTASAEKYSAALTEVLGSRADEARIDLGLLASAPGGVRRTDWYTHMTTLRAAFAALPPPRPEKTPEVADGWTLRQLTFGSASNVGHFHSYYDIPVLNADATHVAAVRFDRPERPPEPRDTVEVGVVDIATGGFRRIGETRAWSWQQGPMLQWLTGSDRLVWNERSRGRFQACIAHADATRRRYLDRPVYAVDPNGRTALSLDFARLDAMRPGYGYAGGMGGQLDEAAPEGDGLWHVDIEAGTSRLILSLARGVEVLHRVLTVEERAEHAAKGYRYWFNHCKFSPDGRRFAVKLRWRALKGGWTGIMGVSITCGTDGDDPRVIARAASHVMWYDERTLYFWNQRDGYVARREDVELVEPIEARRLAPETFTSNIHVRHLPTAPSRMIYDVPYSETVDLREIDTDTDRSAPIATFPNHKPPKGPYRCDLHPVPTPDGNRVIVTSLADGARQIYVLDRKEA